jgi:hypothetical protein
MDYYIPTLVRFLKECTAGVGWVYPIPERLQYLVDTSSIAEHGLKGIYQTSYADLAFKCGHGNRLVGLNLDVDRSIRFEVNEII